MKHSLVLTLLMCLIVIGTFGDESFNGIWDSGQNYNLEIRWPDFKMINQATQEVTHKGTIAVSDDGSYEFSFDSELQPSAITQQYDLNLVSAAVFVVSRKNRGPNWLMRGQDQIVFIRTPASIARNLLGTWKVTTTDTFIQKPLAYTHPAEPEYIVFRDEKYLDDKSAVVRFDFVDADIVTIQKADGTSIKGFYKVGMIDVGKPGAIFRHYLSVQDRTREYLFGVSMLGPDSYRIAYRIPYSYPLPDVYCVATMEKTPE